ncbi:hypothetical protein F5X99DRAFT_391186 [Biscogniauxia marginata]|nr:hypothetical protein F5X99DRAFT_391186 [Biscogniauxia marginata]
MFLVRRHVRNISTPLIRSRRHVLPSTRRGLAERHIDSNQLNAGFPLAEQLLATGTWKVRKDTLKESAKESAKGGSKTRKRTASPATNKTNKVKGDKTRVNIVSEPLCDDIFSYIGSSLDRHRGCDIVDIYPGAGLWSRKLNDYLQPRSHILMEPDEEFYRPFLQPLLDRPGTKLVPKSGIVWTDLYSVLDQEHLPHQVVADGPSQMQRNDTLLVTANFAFHPKRRYRMFDSIAQLLLHQFVDAVRTSTIFQRYGQVRMLVWTRCEEKSGLLPKSLQKRKRGALVAELACEWVHEVCGRDGVDSAWFTRETAIDMSSTVAAIQRMQAAGMRMPAGRESEAFREALDLLESGQHVPVPGEEPPTFKRAFQDTLAELEAANEKEALSRDSAEFKTMRGYTWRSNWEGRKHNQLLEFYQALIAISKLYGDPTVSPEVIKEREAKWIASIQNKSKGFVDEFSTYRDNLHYFKQSPPILHWDRRFYEPMAMRAEEFLPNVECSLLDIQPKPVHPLLRQTGPSSNRASDSFDMIVSSMLGQCTLPLAQSLDGLYPGAADYIMPRFTSLKATESTGIIPDLRYAQPTPRLLNTRQWEQLLELWMEWPFRPGFHELIARTTEETTDGKHEDTGPLNDQ